jgi:hypothetical protein
LPFIQKGSLQIDPLQAARLPTFALTPLALILHL